MLKVTSVFESCSGISSVLFQRQTVFQQCIVDELIEWWRIRVYGYVCTL